MPRRFVYIALVAALTMPFVLTQCASNRRYVVSSKNKAPDSDRYQIEMSITYLNEKTLIERFGDQDNPYLTVKSYLGGSDLISFEVTVSNGTPEAGTVVIPLTTMFMRGEDKSFPPVSAFRLAEYWKSLLDKGGRTYDSDRAYDIKSTGAHMEYVIKKTMWADPVEVKSGSMYSGVVAFMGRFTSSGWGEIHIPVFDDKNRVIGIFKEEFERD